MPSTNPTVVPAHSVDINQLFEDIARAELFVDTLTTQHSDSLDFHDVSVWGVKAALQRAFDAGFQIGQGRLPASPDTSTGD